MYIHIYIYTHIYVYMYVYAYVLYMYICIAYTYIYIHVYMCVSLCHHCFIAVGVDVWGRVRSTQTFLYARQSRAARRKVVPRAAAQRS